MYFNREGVLSINSFVYIEHSLDELLVGAPLYRANSSEPETGRVFLYKNTRVHDKLTP